MGFSLQSFQKVLKQLLLETPVYGIFFQFFGFYTK